MRRQQLCSMIAITAVALLFQFSLSTSKDLWGKVTPEEWALTPPADYPDAQVAVLADVCTLTVELSGIRCERYARLKVFKKEGADELNDFGFLRDEDDKTVSFKAQTILPDGRIVKVDKKSSFKRTAGSWQVLSVAFPAVEPGCIVEVKYVGAHHRFTFLEPWNFQSELYTYLSRMTIVLAPGFVYNALFTHVSSEFQTPVKDERVNIDDVANPFQLFTWERIDLPPVDVDEPYAGLTREHRARLLCQLIKYDWAGAFVDFSNSWDELGKLYSENLVQPYLNGGEVDRVFTNLVNSSMDNSTKVAELYKFVKDSTILMKDTGSSFCNNATAGDFLKSRAGTEFDINLLLVALLNKASISAQLLMVPSREDYTLSFQAPMLSQLTNSLVLAEFDSSFAILDPSNKFCTAGKISPLFLGQQGLVVAEKGSRVINVGDSEGRSYRMDATEMIIDSAGAAICSTSIGMTGSFPAYYGRDEGVSSDSSWVDFFILNKISEGMDATSSDFDFTSDGKLTCWAKFETDRFTRRFENNLFVKPVVLRFSENPFTSVRRSFPIDFKFPGTWHNLVTIRLSKEPTAISLPGEVSLAIDGATFTRESRKEASVIVVDSKLIITRPLFEAGYYSEVKKFFEQIATAFTDEVSASF